MSIFGERRIFEISFPDGDDLETQSVELTVSEMIKLKRGKRIVIHLKEHRSSTWYHLLNLLVFFTLAMALMLFVASFIMGDVGMGFFAVVIGAVMVWPYVS